MSSMWSSSKSVGEPSVETGHDGVFLDVDALGVLVVAVGVVAAVNLQR